MQKRNIPRSRSGSQAREFSWQYLVLMLFCAGLLATGFFFAARQHFLSMDYGFKNSRLKKQLEDLEAEKRRLLLAREVTLSPFEIRKVSRNLGGEHMAVAASLPASSKAAHQQLKNASVIRTKAMSVDSASTAPTSTKPAVRTLASAARTDTPTATRESKATLELTALAKLR